MDDTEQLRDDESNKHLETYVREQSAVRLQVIFSYRTDHNLGWCMGNAGG
jgi:predicted secreted protein